MEPSIFGTTKLWQLQHLGGSSLTLIIYLHYQFSSHLYGLITFILKLNVNGLSELELESVVIPRAWFFNALMVLWKILGRNESVTVLAQDVDAFRARHYESASVIKLEPTC